MRLTELSKADSIIFDIDGTLWEASESCAMAWNQALRKVGYGNHVITVKVVKPFSGIKIEKVLMDFFSFMPTEHHKALLENYRIFEAREMRLEDGKERRISFCLPKSPLKLKLFVAPQNDIL